MAPATAAGPVVSAQPPAKSTAGGYFPVAVTVSGLPAGKQPQVSLIGAGQTECGPASWTNAAKTAAKAQCWVIPPVKVGAYSLTAQVRSGGVTARSVTRQVPITTPPSTQVSGQERRNAVNCYRSSSTVSLTFDDFGSASQVRSVVATLNRNNVRGRFFLQGSWAKKNPALVNHIKASGHYVDNHTWTHTNLAKASNATVAREVGTHVSLNGRPTLLRPPYGAGAFDKRVHAAAAARGQKVCYWTVDTRDWTGASTAAIVNRVRYGDATTPPVMAGGVVLMHLHGRNTTTALPGVIGAVRAKGLKLEPLR
jgi:peptidoglycan/xylan/chitin deacetylase (PgdA/CDA1 family)